MFGVSKRLTYFLSNSAYHKKHPVFSFIIIQLLLMQVLQTQKLNNKLLIVTKKYNIQYV